MIEKHIGLCTEVAANLQEVRQIWLPSKSLSCIETNQGELVFFSTRDRYQVIGRPSVWLDDNFLKDMNNNAKTLANEITAQVASFRKDGIPIITTPQWLAQMDNFMSIKNERYESLNTADIELVETQMWVELLENQSNPIFQDLAIFLKCHLDSDREVEGSQDNQHYRELLESEVKIANQLAEYLHNHSNEVLREAAEWIPQWIVTH